MSCLSSYGFLLVLCMLQVVDVAEKIGNLFGLGRKEPWMEVLQSTQFKNVDQTKLRTLFEFLAFCLKQVTISQVPFASWILVQKLSLQ